MFPKPEPVSCDVQTKRKGCFRGGAFTHINEKTQNSFSTRGKNKLLLALSMLLAS